MFTELTFDRETFVRLFTITHADNIGVFHQLVASLTVIANVLVIQWVQVRVSPINSKQSFRFIELAILALCVEWIVQLIENDVGRSLLLCVVLFFFRIERLARHWRNMPFVLWGVAIGIATGMGVYLSVWVFSAICIALTLLSASREIRPIIKKSPLE